MTALKTASGTYQLDILSAILIGPWCFETGNTLFLVVPSIWDESQWRVGEKTQSKHLINSVRFYPVFGFTRLYPSCRNSLIHSRNIAAFRNIVTSIRVLSDRFRFIWTEASVTCQVLFMSCFSKALLLFSVSQHLNIMDWTHIMIQKWKTKEYPNGVIIGQMRHLSDKCSLPV